MLADHAIDPTAIILYFFAALGAGIGLYAAHRKGVALATEAALAATHLELEAYKSRADRNAEEIELLRSRIRDTEAMVEQLRQENATLRSAISPEAIQQIADRMLAMMSGKIDELASLIREGSRT